MHNGCICLLGFHLGMSEGMGRRFLTIVFSFHQIFAFDSLFKYLLDAYSVPDAIHRLDIYQ